MIKFAALFSVLKPIMYASVLSTLIAGCGADNALTQQEKEVQSRADIAVSGILFDAQLDDTASYNVRKDGHVEIEFAKSVSLIDYTLVVEKLRANRDIKHVSAIQSGTEVCPLK